MNASELEQVWANLPTGGANPLSGLRVSGLPPDCRLYTAADTRRRRQLLVEVLGDIEPLNQRGMRGLEVCTDDLQVGDSPASTYIQLICLDPIHNNTFAGLCADVITAVRADPHQPRAAITRCLDRWRSFWMVAPAGLSYEKMLGLFGELWFLRRWLAPVTPTKLNHWGGPNGERHDFQWPSYSIEIKTAVAGPNKTPIHFIANLDQLSDPASGALMLFSLHLADDALAKNTLPALVNQIEAEIVTDPDGSRAFSEKLAAVGYSPAEAERYNLSFRVVAEELYAVGSGFPRLTRTAIESAVPAGVENISYCLAISACAKWRIAKAPGDSGAAFLRDLA